MKIIYAWALASLLLMWALVGATSAEAAPSPRRSVECQTISKLYDSVHQKVKKLDDVAIAQAFTAKLETDMQVLNFEDQTLQTIQSQYIADFHEMTMILKNIREGQLVGDNAVFDRMEPYYTATAQHINHSTQQLNSYCQGVWGYKPIPTS